MKGIVKGGVTAVVIVAALSCGYFYGKRSSLTAGAGQEQARTTGYTCPMHPFIVKSQPGACDICGMELVKKVAGSGVSDKELQNVSHVALSPTQQVIANVSTVAAAVKPLSREITCTGMVSYDQKKQGKVAAWVAGRLDRLLVNSVGATVRKERPVAEIFSVDLYNAEVQYLLAYRTLKILNSSFSVTFPNSTQLSLAEAHERLRQLGFREAEFNKLKKSVSPSVRIPIYSPFSGVVTEKLVQEGQYVNVGEPLFSIADLSRVWVELELFEGDFPFVKTGQEVNIVAKSYPGKTFHGKVTFIYPFLAPKTRTVKVRVELPNPGLTLKPDMYVTAVIKSSQPDSLVVPATAVMNTGKRQLVWVETQSRVFVPREVTTGVKSGGEVQILSGLSAGEKVAASGAYLIDSEAQLSRGGEVTAPAAPAPTKPGSAPAHRDDMDMKDMKMH